MAFSDQGPRTICILSASGAVCRVTLRQASHSGGTVSYEGRFEIVTLSGSFLNYEVNGSMNRSGSLSVSLAGPDGSGSLDGRIVGGSVVGSLVAATQVQALLETLKMSKGLSSNPSFGIGR
ncbi:PREDICTED: AT-hook motif nuclear-localized protein 8 isoform X2 [Camelina sativa]|uniref:AT-hook motif nuclear-localized protein n=1 Tax=Camelina sativa TaxID=90675 RepID=A0ABM0TGU5_CAMSA|nr:PREDICTED: AT-hook motif nuclear-localized protein 8 isoform X2 [Camelina sativa]